MTTINFMMPSTGAFTLDGTIIILLGLFAIAFYLYKNKNNINLKKETKIENIETNIINNSEKNFDILNTDENSLKNNNNENNISSTNEINEEININSQKIKEKIKI